MNTIEQYRKFYSSESSDVEYICYNEDCKGILDSEHLQIMYPIDPTTGLINSDLSKISNPMLSNAERASIMDRLQHLQGSYLPAGLSDEDIYKLVPPRYFNGDDVDIAYWRKYIVKDILPNMSDTVVTALGDGKEVVSDVDNNNNNNNGAD